VHAAHSSTFLIPNEYFIVFYHKKQFLFAKKEYLYDNEFKEIKWMKSK